MTHRGIGAESFASPNNLATVLAVSMHLKRVARVEIGSWFFRLRCFRRDPGLGSITQSECFEEVMKVLNDKIHVIVSYADVATNVESSFIEPCGHRVLTVEVSE